MSKFSEEIAAQRAARNINGPTLADLRPNENETATLTRVGLDLSVVGKTTRSPEGLTFTYWNGIVLPERGEGAVLLATLQEGQTLGRTVMWSIGAYRPEDLEVYGDPEAFLRAAEHVPIAAESNRLHQAISDFSFWMS